MATLKLYLDLLLKLKTLDVYTRFWLSHSVSKGQSFFFFFPPGGDKAAFDIAASRGLLEYLITQRLRYLLR